MVDIATLQYKVMVKSKKKTFNITDYIQNLSWEENKGELSARTTFTARNDNTSRGYLASLVKPGCQVAVYAKHGKKKYKEVVRGEVVVWNPTNQNSAHDIKCVCYDGLYSLQKSQDNFFFRSGTGTKSRIRKVLDKWNVPLGKYEGPDVKHGKKKYQNKYLSDILRNILRDASRKSGRKYVIRMEKSKVTVVPRGGNSDIYVFTAGNTKVVTRNKSTEELVTRVKVVSREKGSKKNKAVATLDGLTKYGVRQRIYTGGSDESVKEAKKAAQGILDDSGVVKKQITVQCPDVPYIRKGDLVYMDVGAVKGYYFVLGIQHDAASAGMTMDIKFSGKGRVSKNKVTSGGELAGGGEKSPEDCRIGDIVSFKGGKHYVSSTSSKGFPAKAGKAKITKKNESGRHPYHLVHTNSKSNVYGWVDEGTFS